MLAGNDLREAHFQFLGELGEVLRLARSLKLQISLPNALLGLK